MLTLNNFSKKNIGLIRNSQWSGTPWTTVYQLDPVQFNTNTDLSEFVFICTSININALKVLMFHWKHTCAVDLLHVKCCKNMQTQPHRCHKTLNSYTTNVFLTQSTILFYAIVFWYCESFFHWWSPLLLGEVVKLLVFFVWFTSVFGGSLE